jgi:hypothetical protein
MEADQATLLGQVVGGIAVLLIGGFIVYKMIQGIAAFVDALQGGPHPTDADHQEENENDEEQP